MTIITTTNTLSFIDIDDVMDNTHKQPCVCHLFYCPSHHLSSGSSLSRSFFINHFIYLLFLLLLLLILLLLILLILIHYK